MAGDEQSWPAAARFAWRDARAYLRGYRIFIAALALGVAAIAGVGSLSAAFRTGLQAQSRALLGGDISITTIHGEIDPSAIDLFSQWGRLARVVEAQTMATVEGSSENARRTVVQIKGVDGSYPLFGAVILSHDMDLEAAFAPAGGGEDRPWGAVADPSLFARLGLDIGDVIAIGGARFELRARLLSEPDRATAGFLLGPRVMTSRAAIEASGVAGAGAIVDRSYRIALDDPGRLQTFKMQLTDKFPDHAWRVRDHEQTLRGFGAALGNLEVFMTMAGLAALVIGGLGAANAIGAYLRRKAPVIATLKSIGASSGFVFRIYVVQIAAAAAGAIALGLVIGAALPMAGQTLFRDILPFGAAIGLYAGALAQAALFGALATVIFTVWPLSRARATPPARLFREISAPPRSRPGGAEILVVMGAAAAVFALAVGLAPDREVALYFALGGLGAYGALRGLAAGLAWGVRRLGRPRRPAMRMAFANLTRPGAATPGVVVALGLGLTLMAAVSLIDVNLTRQVEGAFPERAPTLFFADIAFEEADAFDALAGNFDIEDYRRYPMMRAGVAAVNGVPVRQVEGAERSPWVRDGDWGVTYLAAPRDGEALAEGAWWGRDYSGPPLVSLSKWQAELLGLKVGDALTFAISGRLIEAEIASLRDIDWSNGEINFVAIFSPGVLEAARPTSIGSLRVDNLDTEMAVYGALSDAFPGATIIRTREAAAPVAALLSNISLAVRALSGVTIVAGLLVLLGAMAVDYRARLYDAMVMKAIGAERARIFAVQAIEYAVLGLAPAVLALGLSSLASFVVVDRVMELDWSLPAGVALGVVFGALALTLGLGSLAAWRILGARPWPVLRSD